MNRRQFITLLGGAASLWPFAARAQPPVGMRRIGVLMAYADGPLGRRYVATLRRALEEAGWVEGRNVRIDERWGGGDADRVRLYAVELVDLKPDVIVAGGGRAVEALKQQTRDIPIVFEGPSDPVLQGFVASMARPGGNLTGFSSFEPSIVGKLAEALREVAPQTTRVALMFHPDNPGSPLYLQWFEKTVPSFAMKGMTARAAIPAKSSSPLQQLRKCQTARLWWRQTSSCSANTI
jgi:ABC-type uncharacterized transport system substrate-binding protein